MQDYRLKQNTVLNITFSTIQTRIMTESYKQKRMNDLQSKQVFHLVRTLQSAPINLKLGSPSCFIKSLVCMAMLRSDPARGGACSPMIEALIIIVVVVNILSISVNTLLNVKWYYAILFFLPPPSPLSFCLNPIGRGRRPPTSLWFRSTFFSC